MQPDKSCTKFFLKCSCVFPFSKIAAKKKHVKVVWLKMWLSLVDCGVLSCNKGRNFCIRDENKMQIATWEVRLWQNFLYGEDVYLMIYRFDCLCWLGLVSKTNYYRIHDMKACCGKHAFVRLMALLPFISSSDQCMLGDGRCIRLGICSLRRCGRLVCLCSLHRALA